jgi:ubiquinone/menaquinone biosynthesis C-methylase UbiE
MKTSPKQSPQIEVMPRLESTQDKAEKDRLFEAMQNANTITVEFGTGDLPLFNAQDTVRYDSDNLYIGINVDSKQHDYLASRVENIQGIAVLASFEGKVIEKLPVADASVDVVFMANVLGEPESEYIMHDFKHGDGKYRGSSSIESKVRTLHESARILKDTGYLVVLENNTPYMDWRSREEPYSNTVELLKVAGLEIIDAIDQRDESWNEVVGQYAKPTEGWSDYSYLVVAKDLSKSL